MADDNGALFDPGNGLGALTRGNVIAIQQTCDTYAQLQAITGVPGMQVRTRGGYVINDGGQGDYYWSRSSNLPNNPPAVIAPTTGSSTGRWLLLANTPGIGIWTVRVVKTLGDATVLVTDQIISMQIPAASATITLPSPALYPSRGLTFKDGLGNAFTYPTILTVGGGFLIDAANSYTLNTPWGSINLFSDGTQWSIF